MTNTKLKAYNFFFSLLFKDVSEGYLDYKMKKLNVIIE